MKKSFKARFLAPTGYATQLWQYFVGIPTKAIGYLQSLYIEDVGAPTSCWKIDTDLEIFILKELGCISLHPDRKTKKQSSVVKY